MWEKPGTSGSNGPAVFLFPGCRECAEGTPVKSAHSRDNLGSFGGYTGEFESCLNRFGAGVAKKKRAPCPSIHTDEADNTARLSL